MNTYDDSDEHTDNWNEYLTNINERYDQMYSLINYNQFVNEEVRMLDRRLRYLNKDFSSLKAVCFFLSKVTLSDNRLKSSDLNFTFFLRK